MGRCQWLLAVCLLFVALPLTAAEAAVWQRLAEPGHLVLVRHAIAPGTGDPKGFRLDECATQRNLSAAGRAQAQRMGERLRANGLDRAAVYSSQWCRCMETASLLGVGNPLPLPALNSFYGEAARGGDQTREILQWLGQQPQNAKLILVTHQVNITALTGVYPASGEMLVLRRLDDGAIELVGRIRTDEF
ncbi:hypothetical protein GCM10011348_05660 [Marinobacterium nitratireducens]|uniref:Histidine phosphatase family protein n=1 Tax=Marinobacterium nitratireducens TaxID=518897 RepID=A0A918DPW4_9GAMM|nr:histidine phosphatase family protein [Marinobacterium nitratireducens]GGO77028.1 hypothetical protein GCM10011348_05660 [Marinobacterium nitratireducens]